MWPIAQAVVLGVLLGFGSSQNGDEYTDENRPYEFGFLIDGEQHRYEKKDEKGIIMGEYGFITADGVYHVTVYATDENGNFIILKTRNIRIGLHMAKPTTTTTQRPKVLNLNGLRGCSGCLIPETTNAPPTETQPNLSRPDTSGLDFPIDVRGKTNVRDRFKAQETPGISSLVNRPKNDQYFNNQGRINVSPKSVPQTNKQQEILKTPSTGAELPIDNRGQRINSQGTPGIDSLINRRTDKKNFNVPPSSVSGMTDKADGVLKESPQYSVKAQDGVDLRTPGTTPNHILKNTEMKILDFMARLYKFNYTLSFHGHEEEGDVEGSKKGSYFNNGRDGYQRKVMYLANEFGYQPVITLETLDASDTPNENTEKELTQLKGSEFIWFYNKIKNGLK